MQSSINQCNITYYRTEASTGASEAAIGDSVYRQTHNLKVAGSNPAPATNSSPWKPCHFRGFLILGTLLPFVDSTLNQHMPLGVDDRRHRRIPAHPAPRPGQPLGHLRQEAGRPYSPACSIQGVPNRRFIDSGLYLPATHSEGLRPPCGAHRHLALAGKRNPGHVLDGDPRRGRGAQARYPRRGAGGHTSAGRGRLRVRRFARGDHGQGPGRDDLPSGVRVGRAGRRHPRQLPVPRRYGVRSLPCRTVRRSLCCGAIGNRLPPEHLREPWGVRIDIAA